MRSVPFLFRLLAAAGLKSCRVFQALNFLGLFCTCDGDAIGYDDR